MKAGQKWTSKSSNYCKDLLLDGATKTAKPINNFSLIRNDLAFCWYAGLLLYRILYNAPKVERRGSGPLKIFNGDQKMVQKFSRESGLGPLDGQRVFDAQF